MKTILLVLFFTFAFAADRPTDPLRYVFTDPYPETDSLKKISTNPYKASAESMAWVRFLHEHWYNRPPYEKHKLRNHPLLKKNLHYQSLQINPTSPWVFYVPGIFTYLDSPFVHFFSTQLSELGYNVLTVPNTFTSDFLRSHPQIKPGSIAKEASLFCDLVVDFKKNKGIDRPIELIGVSYGGLLASAIASQCQKQFKQLTLVSPPVNLAKSMQKVFGIVNSSRKNNPNLFSSPQWWMYLQAKLVNSNRYQDLLSRFFVDGLYYTFFYHQWRVAKNPGFQELKYGTKEYIKWQKSTDIQAFYVESDQSLEDPQYQLKNWLSELEKKNFPFFVYSSLDDPINSSEQWHQLKQHISPKRFGLMSKGGHLGLITSNWFSHFLEKRLLEN